MTGRLAETIIGAGVLLAAMAALYTAYSSSQVRAVDGQKIVAKFHKVGGLQEGNAVRIGGLQVGTIVSQRLDPQSLDAVLEFSIRSDLRLPVDTVADVASDGLLGGKFVMLTPGKSKDLIPMGGMIQKTNGVVALEETVADVIFNSTRPRN